MWNRYFIQDSSVIFNIHELEEQGIDVPVKSPSKTGFVAIAKTPYDDLVISEFIEQYKQSTTTVKVTDQEPVESTTEIFTRELTEDVKDVYSMRYYYLLIAGLLIYFLRGKK